MKYLIAIDPDLHKSGIAIYDTEKKCLLEVTTLALWDVFDLIKKHKEDYFIIEYSDKTSTWHKGGKGAALNVGKNKAIGQTIIAYFEHLKSNFKVVKPAGYSNYYTTIIKGKKVFLEEQFKKDHCWDKRTSNDSRAAVAMIWEQKKLLNNLFV